MSKGSNAERDLAQWAWDNNRAALRAPGSGSIDRPSPDVVIFSDPLVAIELKANADGTATFAREEIDELIRWADRCGGVAYVGVKPDLRSHSSWFFRKASELHETPEGNYSIRKQDHEKCVPREELL